MIISLCFYFLSIQSCAFCGREQAGEFHRPLEIDFQNGDGIDLISPIGLYNFESSVIYNETGVQVDTAFSGIKLSDWNESWIDENVEYTRIYNMYLERLNIISEPEKIDTFQFQINYWGEINNCNNYEINRIQILLNDSLYIDSEFISFHVINLPN